MNLPDKIEIQFYDKANKPLEQKNLLVGIKTFAARKNDIDLSPFLSDSTGRIEIKKDDLIRTADDFISYGMMDFAPLESAEPNIEIYFWGNDRLEKCLEFLDLILSNKRDLENYEKGGGAFSKSDKEAAMIEKREREMYAKFETCFNRQTQIKSDVTLVKDIWDGTESHKIYKVRLEL